MEPDKKSRGIGKGTPGPGRPKGALNKDHKLIRDMIAGALDQLGGVDYLVECGNDPKTRSAFLALIGKTMPVQVTGEGGGAVQHSIKVTFG